MLIFIHDIFVEETPVSSQGDESLTALTTISFPYRYMNISDEWETPEKQPFKDFVRVSSD